MTAPRNRYRLGMVGDSAEQEPSDVALMLRTKAGDMDAFQELVMRHQHRVVGTVTKMLRGESDSEDIAQQVFVRVWRSACNYEPTAKFTTWLMTITRNLVFNELRRRDRGRTISLDADEACTLQIIPDQSVLAPDDSIRMAELQRAIEKAIGELPEQQRMAVVLRRYEEMPYEEIAVVLETTVPAVKSMLFRARAELKHKLAKYLIENA